MRTAVKVIINVVLFLVFLAMIIVGQLNTGVGWLGLMILGLAGLLFLLFMYNRPYRERKK